jgi:hypothetical protein
MLLPQDVKNSLSMKKFRITSALWVYLMIENTPSVSRWKLHLMFHIRKNRAMGGHH